MTNVLHAKIDQKAGYCPYLENASFFSQFWERLDRRWPLKHFLVLRMLSQYSWNLIKCNMYCYGHGIGTAKLLPFIHISSEFGSSGFNSLLMIHTNLQIKVLQKTFPDSLNIIWAHFASFARRNGVSSKHYALCSVLWRRKTNQLIGFNLIQIEFDR